MRACSRAAQSLAGTKAIRWPLTASRRTTLAFPQLAQRAAHQGLWRHMDGGRDLARGTAHAAVGDQGHLEALALQDSQGRHRPRRTRRPRRRRCPPTCRCRPRRPRHRGVPDARQRLTGGRSVQAPSKASAARPMRFAQRRVRVDGLADVDRVGAHLDRQRDLADQVAGMGADDAAADDRDAWLSSNSSLVKPSSRPLAIARPDAAPREQPPCRP